jgi:hypothetical protein
MLNVKQIQYSLQLVISVLIALEIALPPNPHTKSLIIAMTIYITLKHGLVEKIEKLLNKWKIILTKKLKALEVNN